MWCINGLYVLYIWDIPLVKSIWTFTFVAITPINPGSGILLWTALPAVALA